MNVNKIQELLNLIVCLTKNAKLWMTLPFISPNSFSYFQCTYKLSQPDYTLIKQFAIGFKVNQKIIFKGKPSSRGDSSKLQLLAMNCHDHLSIEKQALMGNSRKQSQATRYHSEVLCSRSSQVMSDHMWPWVLHPNSFSILCACLVSLKKLCLKTSVFSNLKRSLVITCALHKAARRSK